MWQLLRVHFFHSCISYLGFSVVLLNSWALITTQAGNSRVSRCCYSRSPPLQLPYLAPVSSHPARRRAAAQTAADTDRGFALFWTLRSWECFREVTALAQNNPMLESWTTFGSTLEMKQINNDILKIQENWRKIFLEVNVFGYTICIYTTFWAKSFRYENSLSF